jgi:hypothetical protein
MTPRLLAAALSATLLTLHAALSAGAADTAPGDHAMATGIDWRFFTDTVMGGVSTGRVTPMEEDGHTFLRMTGTVSTANRGGFIQMRTDLAAPPPEGTTGVRLVVRGNGQRYFVHLRTTGTILPWQYYQAGFDTSHDWTEVRLPFASFRASGALLRAEPRPGSLTSLAVVAYGRDHKAEIDVREAGFY